MLGEGWALDLLAVGCILNLRVTVVTSEVVAKFIEKLRSFSAIVIKSQCMRS